ncbi:MAG: hypothetical protein F4138_02530 [Acidimicrobiia bacterium]|nr:hypothetical protein [Acidimicrobiia bacterium]MYC57216.1 hypothetical protein [Acidimicrobiia bacterium]MYG93857.1 hypothetical protein [Acidimicrobiia bacterium]MYI29860.1 hypothetical protein [Acidimicrobiia bacterium]
MEAETLTDDTTIERLEEHEAGVADLMAAYDLVGQSYFPAARAAAPLYMRIVASNTTQVI